MFDDNVVDIARSAIEQHICANNNSIYFVEYKGQQLQYGSRKFWKRVGDLRSSLSLMIYYLHIHDIKAPRLEVEDRREIINYLIDKGELVIYELDLTCLEKRAIT